MPISFACKCGKRLTAKEELAGKKIKCPGCGNAAPVPQAATTPAPPATSPISVVCECGKAFKAKAVLLGKRIKCPACQALVTVSENGKPASQKKSPASKSPAPKSAAISSGPKSKAASPATSKPVAKPQSPRPESGKVPAAPPKTPKPATLPPKGKKKADRIVVLALGGLGGLVLVVFGGFYILNRPSSAIVSGAVSLDKQLVLTGTVEITVNKRKISAPVNLNGTYELKEVPFGEAVITVNVPAKLNVKEYDARVKEFQKLYKNLKAKPASIPIPAEYGDVSRTPFKLTVQDATQYFPLAMQGKS